MDVVLTSPGKCFRMALLMAMLIVVRPVVAGAQNPETIVPDSLVRLLHENRDDNEKRAEAFAKVIDFLFDARCYEQAKPYIEDFQESDFVRLITSKPFVPSAISGKVIWNNREID